MERIVGGSFRLRRKIGAGSFGEIYSAEHIQTHRRVAVKLEHIKSRVPQLCYEAKLYQLLQGGTNVPRLFWHGSDEIQNILIIELLGKSLEDLFVKCHRRFTLKTVLILADQMLTSVEYMHNKSFIHRDIKPDNFVMGIGLSSSQLFIIDYGLAKKYRDQHTHAHIPYVEGKSLTGTARYASINALRGAEQSRRDDLESLGFVWLYFLRGSLPWMGMSGRNPQQKYDRVCNMKKQMKFEDLCRGYPSEFVRYFQSVRRLQFTERPNYSELRAMFRNLFLQEGFVYDYQYDWNPPILAAPDVAPTTLPSQLIVQRQGAQIEATAKEAETARPPPEAELAVKRPAGIMGSHGKEVPFRPRAKERKRVQPACGVTPRRVGRDAVGHGTVLPTWIQEH
jgi:serine/threonine protein kinase